MDLFEKIYLFFYYRKKEKDLKNQKKLLFPLISVGNLTLGGTGKTPFSISLANELKKRNYEPIILTRGYRGKIKGPVIVSSEASPEELGDEPILIAQKGFKVVKSIDRYTGGVFAIEKIGITEKHRAVFILDDGFQHWRVYRDINILLVDGIKEFGNGKLFPFGPLRSPLDEISEADFIFITKKQNQTLYSELIKTNRDVYFAQTHIEGVMDLNNQLIEPSRYSFYAFAGVGNFESFIDILKDLNLNIVGYKKLIDHKKYDKKTLKKIEKLAKDAQMLITTEKDFVKIKNLAEFFSHKLCYLEISLKIDREVIDKIEDILNNQTPNLKETF